jgi:acyl-CoA reductase-like NAD-dependent aldehyde dehydrogenase
MDLTHDPQRGLITARRIRAGAVPVGMHAVQSDAPGPVGAVGASGIGRGGGKYSVEEFTELNWVRIELGGPP